MLNDPVIKCKCNRWVQFSDTSHSSLANQQIENHLGEIKRELASLTSHQAMLFTFPDLSPSHLGVDLGYRFRKLPRLFALTVCSGGRAGAITKDFYHLRVCSTQHAENSFVACRQIVGGRERSQVLDRLVCPEIFLMYFDLEVTILSNDNILPQLNYTLFFIFSITNCYYYRLAIDQGKAQSKKGDIPVFSYAEIQLI